LSFFPLPPQSNTTCGSHKAKGKRSPQHTAAALTEPGVGASIQRRPPSDFFSFFPLPNTLSDISKYRTSETVDLFYSLLPQTTLRRTTRANGSHFLSNKGSTLPFFGSTNTFVDTHGFPFQCPPLATPRIHATRPYPFPPFDGFRSRSSKDGSRPPCPP